MTIGLIAVAFSLSDLPSVRLRGWTITQPYCPITTPRRQAR